ncbi:hypothetical protein ANCDUO_18146, partial [Ancylostoma duodenale]
LYTTTTLTPSLIYFSFFGQDLKECIRDCPFNDTSSTNHKVQLSLILTIQFANCFLCNASLWNSQFVSVSRYHSLRLLDSVAGNQRERHMTEVPIRAPIEAVEIAYLSVIVTAAVILNSIVLTQLITTSKAPTVRTSFSIGPYHLNAFTQFKLNLCITDFAILLIYALGKIVWLLTFQWELGNIGCKTYQLLSAFSFYANSNIIVAIGLDRLKVVYTRHIQGKKSLLSHLYRNLLNLSCKTAIRIH